MRNFIFLVVFWVLGTIITQASSFDVPVLTEKNIDVISRRFMQIKPLFDKAYDMVPGLPRGILEAISFENTRWRAIVPEQEEASCVGIPVTYGPMGLIEDKSGYFTDVIRLVAGYSGYTIEEIKREPSVQVVAFAIALDRVIKEESEFNNSKEVDWIAVGSALRRLSGIRVENVIQQYAQDVFVYHILRLMESQSFNNLIGNAVGYTIPWKSLFDSENLRILRDGVVNVDYDNGQVNGGNGSQYRLAAPPCAVPEYPPANWVASPNYSSRSSAPTHIVIHTIQGTYSSCINWFQNPSARASAHYVVSSWGEVTQMVCESKKAWHVRSANGYTIGYEHEGWVSDPVWYTDTMYGTSAALTRNVTARRGINRKRVAWFPWAATTQYRNASRPGACVRIKGHQHYPGQTHTDPGANWDWEFYFRKVNGVPPTTTYTSSSGTFYDSGGPSGNYSNDEFRAWVINPPGNAPVALTFSQFNLERDGGGYGWDYLFIWDGTGPDGRFIGAYTGTSSPGTVIGYSGSLYIEFRSDCATTRPGWKATWNTVSVSCQAPSNVQVQNIQPLAALATWNAVPGAQYYTVRYKRHFYNSWQYVQTTDTFLWLTGLAASAHYQWQVNAHCNTTDSSGWTGENFSTLPAKGTWTVTACSGFFVDAGGPQNKYLNSENWTYTIQSPNGNPITISFSSFSTESGYDKLKIYDGSSTTSPLIGTYSGTNSPGTITSSGGALTFRFTSDARTTRSGWRATWSVANCTNTPPPPPPPPPGGGGTPSSNLASIIQSPADSIWIAGDFTAIFKDSGNVKERFYLAIDFGSYWMGNPSRGFLYDRFIANTGQWTPYSGTWTVSAGVLTQSDESNSNTNYYAAVDQTQSPIIMYRWKGKIRGTGTNKRAGLHFFIDNPATTNRNNSYFVYFREDHDKVQIYKVSNNSWTLVKNVSFTINKDQWYIFSVVFNRLSGRIDVYIDSTFVTSWTDTSPHTSGSYVSLRSGNCIYDVDWIEVWKYRSGGSVSVEVGPGKDFRYQSNNGSIVAKLLTMVTGADSTIMYEPDIALYKVDWTGPQPTIVRDGTSSDIDLTYSTNSLSANWDPFIEPHSSIYHYEYAIGVSPGDSSVLSWTPTTSTSFTETGLSLVPGATYYVSVRAFNEAALLGNYVSSDGITIAVPSQPATSVNVPTQWVTGDFPAIFSDQDPDNKIMWRFYNVSSMTSLNRWQANATFGYLYEDFDTTQIPSGWTQYAGSWTINNGILSQADASEGNSNISIQLPQNSTEPILYHWRARIGGNGTNKRVGLHIMVDDPSQSQRGNSYLIYFREDHDVIHILKTINNNLNTVLWQNATINANQWYDFKVFYHPVEGKMLVFINDTLRAQWIDSLPLSSGNYISFRSGNAIYDIDFIRVYKGRTDTMVAITVGSGKELFMQNTSPNTLGGKILSVVVDSTFMISPVSQKMINVDWTEPQYVSIPSDMNVYDVDTLYADTSSISVYWDNFTDPHSSITQYLVCLGTSPQQCDVSPWAITNTTSYTWNNVNLSTNTWYYATVKAVNGAGLQKEATSDGLIIILGSSVVTSSSPSDSTDNTTDSIDLDTTTVSGIYNTKSNYGIMVRLIDHQQSKKLLIQTSDQQTINVIIYDVQGKELKKYTNLKGRQHLLTLPDRNHIMFARVCAETNNKCIMIKVIK